MDTNQAATLRQAGIKPIEITLDTMFGCETIRITRSHGEFMVAVPQTRGAAEFFEGQLIWQMNYLNDDLDISEEYGEVFHFTDLLPILRRFVLVTSE